MARELTQCSGTGIEIIFDGFILSSRNIRSRRAEEVLPLFDELIEFLDVRLSKIACPISITVHH